MNWLTYMSGPLNAAARYLATTAGGVLLARGYVDASGAQAVTGALIALAPAVIGVLTSTAHAKIAATAALPGVASVVRSDGMSVVDDGNGPKVTRFPPPMTDR